MIYRLKRYVKKKGLCGGGGIDCYSCLHIIDRNEDIYMRERKDGFGFEFVNRNYDGSTWCSGIKISQLIPIINNPKERARYLLSKL
jgi:hypothetical protein